MNIYLHKILPLLISPLFLFITLVLIYSIRLRLKILLFSTVLLSILSTPIAAFWFWEKLESGYSLQLPKNIINSDAIVVLSGSASSISTKDGHIYQWADPDRFFGGIALFKAGKAPTLIFTGGKLPWDSGPLTEGEYLRGEAILQGVPEENILVTRSVQNTEQEANAVKALVPEETTHITLVTSAFHMPRASKIFESQAFKVTPYAVDFKANSRRLTILSFIPSTSGINGTFSALREFLGRLYYRIRE